MSNLITLTYNATSIAFAMPLFGYTSTIELPFDIIRDNSGRYHGYDHGSIFDKRYCECTFQLTATQQEALNNFLSSTARAKDITMTLPTGSGFFPFGPDKGDAGVFTVSFEITSQRGRIDEPRDYFECSCRIINVGSYPSYSLPTQRDDGNSAFQIGTITNLRYPPELIQSTTDYAITHTLMSGPVVQYGDRSATADMFTVDLPMKCNQTKAAALLNYLVGTIRLSDLSVITDSQFYLFGRDKDSSGTYTTMMIQEKITISHPQYDQFSFTISLQWKS